MSDERVANAVDRRLGQRLRGRRLEIGMSQERLAELLGVTFQQVQKYEKGANRIAASRLFDIAAALDVQVAYFYEGLTAPSGGAGASGVREEQEDMVYDTLASPEGLQLLRLFSGIKNAKVRRRVVELVRALADDEAEE
jgi:transcriptional regulator with XRE-family HTH domain